MPSSPGTDQDQGLELGLQQGQDWLGRPRDGVLSRTVEQSGLKQVTSVNGQGRVATEHPGSPGSNSGEVYNPGWRVRCRPVDIGEPLASPLLEKGRNMKKVVI